jgi:hypothetical protein
MTRIPEGLRRRLEREAKFRGRSMNAVIVSRLQESFDIPDMAGAVVEDVTSEIESQLDGWGQTIRKSLDEVRSDIRAILARLDAARPNQTASIPALPKADDEGEQK